MAKKKKTAPKTKKSATKKKLKPSYSPKPRLRAGRIAVMDLTSPEPDTENPSPSP